MNLVLRLFGSGADLDILQMTLRGVVIFFITLILIRLAGRRSFGMHSAFDNVISILLGAILARAVVGASPFFPTVMAALVIAILHRFIAWIAVFSDWFGNVTKGTHIPLYKKGRMLKQNLARSLVSEADVFEGVRLAANTEALDNVETVYMERNGQISVVEKSDEQKD